MKNIKYLFKADKIGLLLGSTLLLGITGCITTVQDSNNGYDYAQPVPMGNTVVVQNQDSYIYYPRYDVYYNNYSRQYTYQNNGRWVNSSNPRGIPVHELRSSPCVKSDFRGSPSKYNNQMVKKYPKNWTPDDSDRGHNNHHNKNYKNHSQDDNHSKSDHN